MRCDVIAIGIINAAKEIGIQKPIVIRLQGNHVEEAKTIIDARVDIHCGECNLELNSNFSQFYWLTFL